MYVCFPERAWKKKNLIIMKTHITVSIHYSTPGIREIMMILELRNKTKLNLVDVLSESKEKLKTNVDT